MRIYLRYSIVYFLMGVSFLNAQQTFVKTANLNSLNFGQCLSPTSDGGYVISGQDKLFIAPANSFCQSYIVKIDSCTNISYRVNFEHNGNPRIKSLGARHIIEGANPSQFIIAGTLTKQDLTTHMYAMLVDITTGVNWVHQFVNTALGQSQGAHVSKVTGGYIISGYVDAEPKKPYIAKISIVGGALMWDKAFSSLAGLYSYANYTEEFPNGDILVLGSYGNGPNNNFYAMRLTSTGAVIWSKQYDVSQFDGQDWDVSGKITSGGTFLISGSTKQATDYNAVLIKADASNGSLIHTSIINNTGNDERGRSVMELANGNFVQVGYTANLLGTSTHVLMNCLNPAFNHLWSTKMTLNNYSKAWSITERCDKGLVYSGESFDGANYDALFVKTDSMGQIYNCGYSQQVAVSVLKDVDALTNPLTVEAPLAISGILSNYLISDYPVSTFHTNPSSGGFVDKCNFYRDTFVVNKTSVCIGDTFRVVVRKVNCVPNSIVVKGNTTNGIISPFKTSNHLSGLDTSYYIIPVADNFKLTYSTFHGCTPHTEVKNILANSSPIVNITGSQSICQNNLDTLYAHVTAGASPFTYSWQGYGTSVNSDIIPLNTNAPMSVTVTVTDINGCKSADATYYLQNYPVPQIYITADAVCLNSLTSFENNSAIAGGTIAAYDWSFFDLANSPIVTSNLISPTNIYPLCSSNNFAQLIATSDKGCKDSLNLPVKVYCNPTADFISDSVCLGGVTTLLDVSNGNGHPLSSYSWDFSANVILNNTGQASISYPFANYGNTSVSYTVYSAPTATLNCNNSIIKNVWVNPNPVPSWIAANKCINTQPVIYDASASSIPIGSNTAYNWSYGDASVGNGLLTNHVYTSASLYQTSLTITSDKGCSVTTHHDVEVYEKPYLIMHNSSTCDKKLMSFTATPLPNSGHVDTWQWDVNNNIATFELTGPMPKYLFPSAGSKTVTLISTTNKGCKDTLQKAVYVNYLPIPQFVVDNPSGCYLPHCVNFTNHTPAIPLPAQQVKWTWIYGDDTYESVTMDSIQSHCYSNFSSYLLAYYSVKLIVTTDSGCVDSITKPSMITVFPKPIANFVINPDQGNVLTPLEYFTNTSQDYTKWWWNFGDSNTQDSVNLNPTHYYSYDVKTYDVTLMVANQYGCRDTAIVPLVIGPEFVFYIPNAFTPDNRDGVNDIFTGKGIGIVEYEMWIFDRWGDQIYYTNDIEKGWNGKVQNKEKICQQDVYIWKVRLKDVFNREHDYVGHVTLLK